MVSHSERDRRHRAVRSAMDAAGVDILLAVSDGHSKGDVRYLVEHPIWSQRGYVVMTGDAGPFLVVAMSSQDYWAKRTSWAREVKWSATPIREVIPVVKSLSTSGRTLGVSGLDDLLPVREYEQLKTELSGLTIRDATDVLQAVRARKSPEEIAAVKHSADIAAGGFDRLRDCARAGASEFEVVGEVERVVRAAGAGSTLMLTSEGPYLRDPRARTLQRGDFQMFSIELCGPEGYWVELGGMVAIGGLDGEAESLHAACELAFQAGVAAITVGSRCSDVARAIGSVFEASGLTAGIWGGHGIGLDTLERPRLTAADDTIISEGMTFGLHPHLLDGPRRRGAYVADTVVASSAGPRILGRAADRGSLIVLEGT